MNLNQQFILAAVGVALSIIILAHFNNLIINIISAPLLGVVATVVPAALTDDLTTSRIMWVASAVAVFLCLEWVRSVELDFRRPLIGAHRRRAARRAVASEVKGWRFEVES